MRPGTRSSSRAWTTNSPLLLGWSDKSTIPVNSLGPRPPSSIALVLTWCQMCSSTPSRVTFSNRDGSVSAACSSGLIEDHTVRQPQPSWRRTPLTDACSRRICWTAHQAARVVSFDRGAATRSSCSTNDPTGHPGSGHTQRRLRHTIRTGHPKAGASTKATSTRP